MTSTITTADAQDPDRTSDPVTTNIRAKDSLFTASIADMKPGIVSVETTTILGIVGVNLGAAAVSTMTMIMPAIMAIPVPAVAP